MSFTCLYVHTVRELQHYKSIVRKAESVQFSKISPETNHWSWENAEDICFIFSKLFVTCLHGDNYIDYVDDVITKLRHQHMYSNF